ncbi:hypothetical protein JHW43_003872 [Diplocarpon mali]|nr:hypothetical protein JHW43_003872 [Diplocarpon mali]
MCAFTSTGPASQREKLPRELGSWLRTRDGIGMRSSTERGWAGHGETGSFREYNLRSEGLSTNPERWEVCRRDVASDALDFAGINSARIQVRF